MIVRTLFKTIAPIVRGYKSTPVYFYSQSTETNQQTNVSSAQLAPTSTKQSSQALLQNLLSEKSLSLCSPLMRGILSNASKKQIKVVPQSNTKAQQEPAQSNLQSKHDLNNFRHMLAGPILNQANLDKFCVKKPSPLVADIKYDGERTMISYKKGETLEMISRNGKSQDDVYSKLLVQIQRQLQEADIESIKLDGEIMAIDKQTQAPLPIGELFKHRRLRQNEPQAEDTNEKATLLVYIFDVLQKNGKDLLQTQLLERRKLIPQLKIFRTVEHKIIHFPQERAKIFQFFKEALEKKYEGLIIKGSKDFYFTNQSRTHWKKLKRGFANSRDSRISKIELDLIVMGGTKGRGTKNTKIYTSFLLGTMYKGNIIPVSNVGSGLTQEMLVLINKHIEQSDVVANEMPKQYKLEGVKTDAYFKPQLVFQVHAQELSISPMYKLGAGEYGGLSLRFPIFKGIRADKGVNQATKGEQILQLSKSFNFNLPS